MGAETGLCETRGEAALRVHVAAGTYDIAGFNLSENVSLQGLSENDTVLQGTVRGLRTGRPARL